MPQAADNSAASEPTGKAFRIFYVCLMTLVMLGLIGFGYYYDENHSYATRTAAETGTTQS